VKVIPVSILVAAATIAALPAASAVDRGVLITPAGAPATVKVRLPANVPVRHVKKYALKKAMIAQLRVSARWAKTAKPRAVRARESGNRYRINTGNGYYGAYQYSADTWRRVGGTRFAAYANQAPPWAQDFITYKTVKRYGWGPWGG